MLYNDVILLRVRMLHMNFLILLSEFVNYICGYYLSMLSRDSIWVKRNLDLSNGRIGLLHFYIHSEQESVELWNNYPQTFMDNGKICRGGS